MAFNTGEGAGTVGTRQLADEQDGHQRTDARLEGEDTTALLGRIEALERALRAGHSPTAHKPPSIANPGHGRQLIMTIRRVKGHTMT